MSHVDSVCAEKTSLSHIYDTRALNRKLQLGAPGPNWENECSKQAHISVPKCSWGVWGSSESLLLPSGFLGGRVP